METIDDDIAARSADFIDRTNQTGKPFFMWINFTHMHLRTHPKPASVGQSGRWQDTYHDVMIDHDRNVGTVLAKLDEFGLTENTIVIYGTDNGPHANTWPDGATTPFRSEKNTNWEGAFRVPYLIRWPGKIRAGIVSNEVVSHHEWMPTLVAAAGMPDLKERLLAGYTVGDRTFNVHLDGYNLLPYLTGQEAKTPRPGFFYFSDDGDLMALRFDNWKVVFAQQRSPGTLALWGEPFVNTRIPWLYDLRTGPFEPATITSNTYWDWYMDHAFIIMPTQTIVQEFFATFKDYPPRQKAASFTIDQILQQMTSSLSKD